MEAYRLGDPAARGDDWRPDRISRTDRPDRGAGSTGRVGMAVGNPAMWGIRIGSDLLIRQAVRVRTPPPRGLRTELHWPAARAALSAILTKPESHAVTGSFEFAAGRHATRRQRSASLAGRRLESLVDKPSPHAKPGRQKAAVTTTS